MIEQVSKLLLSQHGLDYDQMNEECVRAVQPTPEIQVFRCSSTRIFHISHIDTVKLAKR
jgi:hypothetical protein